MKNNKLFVFVIGFAFAFILPFIFSSFGQNTFAQEEFILIENYDQLKSVFLAPNAFEKHYKLENDIDFTEKTDFLPLGLSFENGNENITSFKGVFDGNGYSIIGLNFNSLETFYTYGLFAKLENAQIKNLKLKDVLISNDNVFNPNTLNNKTILVGSVAAISEASVIENVQINFVPTNLMLSGQRVDFGGVVARAYYGTTIKNVKVSAEFEFEMETEKLQMVNLGLVAGEVANSYIHNIVAFGSFKIEKSENLNQITILNLGSLVGSLEGKLSLLKATYSNVIFEIIELDIDKVNKGALIGLVKEFDSPNALNLSHNILIAKNKVMEVVSDFGLNQTFGKAEGYDQTASVYHYLTRDNYTALEETSFWTGLVNSYKWNTKTIWKLFTNNLPSLQMFDLYEVEISVDKTRITLSSQISPEDLLIVCFEEEFNQENKNTKKDFKYNEEVTVLIALINDFDVYYKLQSVEMKGNTVINKVGTSGNYTLSQVDQEEETIYQNLDTTKLYLFSFKVSDFDSGEISITLDKVGFDFTVKTANLEEGKIRRKEAQTPSNSLTQTIYVETAYEFVAVPNSLNYAPDKWLMELTDPDTLEIYYLELTQFNGLSNISFEFGKLDNSGVTENFLNGGKLVASFSSNVTKITFMIEESVEGENNSAGQIFSEDETEEFFSSTQVSYIKGKTVSFVAKEKDGYTFIGWYDGENRLRERNQVLTYNTNSEEDDITFIALYEKNAGLNSLKTVWIVLGSVGALAVLATVVIIVIRRRRDMSYKSFY